MEVLVFLVPQTLARADRPDKFLWSLKNGQCMNSRGGMATTNPFGRIRHPERQYGPCVHT